MIDLRSDTCSQPDDAMRRAMAQAPVGDDVYGDDPTVRRLEQEVAALLGKEDAVYMVTGTMTNQVAIHAHTEPGDAVLCDQNAHVYILEGGAAAAYAGVLPRLLPGVRGVFTADDVAAAATGIAESDYARHFDTVSVCFSKGLGAPVGSALAGSREFIARARRFKQQIGGGFRQAGIIAAGALYALQHNRARLNVDHAHARRFAEGIASLPGISVDLNSVETNIVRFTVNSLPAGEFVDRLYESGLHLLPSGHDGVRAIPYLNISQTQIDEAMSIVARVAHAYASRTGTSQGTHCAAGTGY